MTTDVAFWNNLARKYASDPISDVPAYEKTLERVRHYLAADDRALELGCGTGTTALLLADAVAEYTGTDASSEMITIAKEKLAEAPVDGLRFQVSGADAFGTDRHNVILGFNIFHLVPDPWATIEQIHAALPPGGVFISKTPCIGKRWYLRPVVAALKLVGKAPKIVHFLKVDQYDAMIRRAGFEIVETGLYPPSAPSRFIVAKKG